MTNPFFGHPILNAPYELPQRHWELGSQGQPTQQVLERRRRAVSNPSQWQVSRDIALKIHPDAFGVAPVGFEGSG